MRLMPSRPALVRSLIPLVTAGALCAPVAVAPITAAAADKVVTTIGRAEVEANFATPPAGGGDMTLLNEIVRLIDATPSGETIRMAIYSITANYVYDAIVR